MASPAWPAPMTSVSTFSTDIIRPCRFRKLPREEARYGIGLEGGPSLEKYEILRQCLGSAETVGSPGRGEALREERWLGLRSCALHGEESKTALRDLIATVTVHSAEAGTNPEISIEGHLTKMIGGAHFPARKA